MGDSMVKLKEQRIWVLWSRRIKDGKPTKVPFSANGGKTGTNEKYSSTWVTYDEAVKALKNTDASGVAFIVPEGYFFLDADHYDVKDPFIQTLLNRFESYAELSFSGNGIHIYGKCDISKLPVEVESNGRQRLSRGFYTKNPNNNLELYIGGLTNRTAVFTENTINDKPLNDCTEQVILTLDKNMRRKDKQNYSPKRDGNRNDFDIICSMRKQKNGDKFRRLFDDGDITDFGSQSEADASLCSMLAFRTGGDADAIDRLFRQSALYRQKWERTDYRESTINLAIASCRGTFYGSNPDRPYFVKVDMKSGKEHVSSPLLAKYIRENIRYKLVRDNGKQGLLKYVYEGGYYKLYADNMMLGLIKKCIADYNEELVKMCVVNETYQHLVTDLDYVTQDELDSDESIINMQNGLLKIDKDSCELLPHSPDVISTIQIPCKWTGSAADTPIFDSYLDTLTNGDKELKQLLLEFIGACISNIKGYRMKKSLFLTGKGNTGKSQLKSLVERLLGKGNFAAVDLKDIEARFGTGSIYGTRLAGSSDMSFMSVDELKTFKKITGGDSLFAEFKGQQSFEFTFKGLLWFCMNKLPKFGGDDGQWVYDRIIIVNCTNVIDKDKQDKLLLDKMYAEREGIVYKAVKALQKVIANGYTFSEPESVIKTRESYMTDNNTVISFFTECMCRWENGKVDPHCTTGRIYKVYQAWCRENNNGYAKTAKEFRDNLAEHLGCNYSDLITKRNGCSCYKEYTLTFECISQFLKEYGVNEFIPIYNGDDDKFLE